MEMVGHRWKWEGIDGGGRAKIVVGGHGWRREGPRCRWKRYRCMWEWPKLLRGIDGGGKE